MWIDQTHINSHIGMLCKWDKSGFCFVVYKHTLCLYCRSKCNCVYFKVHITAKLLKCSTISVSPRGSVNVDRDNVTLNRGESVNFTCSHMGGPRNALVWLRNGTTVACANCSEVPTPVFNLTG